MPQDEPLLANPYELWCLYCALKSHFNTEGFDYTKYGHRNIKTLTPSAFDKRKDLVIWYRLARRIDIHNAKDFFIANFIENSWLFSFDIAMNMSLAWQLYLDYKKRLARVRDNYVADIKFLSDTIGSWKGCLVSKNDNYPKLFDAVIKKYIAPETYSCLVCLFELGDKRKYKTMIARDIFLEMNRKYKKYRLLVPLSDSEVLKMTPREL